MIDKNIARVVVAAAREVQRQADESTHFVQDHAEDAALRASRAGMSAYAIAMAQMFMGRPVTFIESWKQPSFWFEWEQWLNA